MYWGTTYGKGGTTCVAWIHVVSRRYMLCRVWSEVLLWTCSPGGPLFGEKTHTTGLRELCPGISLVPRLHDRPGNEASSCRSM